MFCNFFHKRFEPVARSVFRVCIYSQNVSKWNALIVEENVCIIFFYVTLVNMSLFFARLGIDSKHFYEHTRLPKYLPFGRRPPSTKPIRINQTSLMDFRVKKYDHNDNNNYHNPRSPFFSSTKFPPSVLLSRLMPKKRNRSEVSCLQLREMANWLNITYIHFRR